MDKDLKRLLSRYPELQVTALGKVKCSLSGHEMPCKLDVLCSYVNGRKFTSLKKHSDFDYASLAPLIIASQKKREMLFCALTNRYMSTKPVEVRGHVDGKRYKKALEEYQSGERKLFDERIKKHLRLQQQHRQQKLCKTAAYGTGEEGEADYSTRLAEMESELLNSELEPDESLCKDSGVKMELGKGGKTTKYQAMDEMDCEEFEEVPLGWRREEEEEEPEEEPEGEGPRGVENTMKSVTGKRKRRDKIMAIAKKLKVMQKRSRTVIKRAHAHE